MENYENIKRCNGIKQNENDDLRSEIEQMMRHITLLQEQNRELESELDKFVKTDHEIRTKLMDRERSPLKMRDLFDGGQVTQEMMKKNENSPALINLEKCGGGSSRSIIDAKP